MTGGAVNDNKTHFDRGAIDDFRVAWVQRMLAIDSVAKTIFAVATCRQAVEACTQVGLAFNGSS